MVGRINMNMKRWQNTLFRKQDNINQKVLYFLIFVMMGIALFATMYGNVRPEVIHVVPSKTSEYTIRAPITVIDEEATVKKQQEALSRVEPVYVQKYEYAENQVDLLTLIYDSTIEVLNKIEQERIEFEIRIAEDESVIYTAPTMNEKLEMLKEKLTDNVTEDLSDNTLRALLNSPKEDLQMARDAVITAVNNVMTKRIPATEVENGKRKVEDEIRYAALPQDLKNATIELGRFAVIQNEFYDPGATEERRQQTIDSLEPVRILQGQIIIEEGDLVTPDIYRQLDLLGFLDTKEVVLPYIGLTLLVLLLLGVIYSFFSKNLRYVENNNHKNLLLFSVVVIISIVLMKIISLIPYDRFDLTFIFPAAMCAMLIKILINDRIAFLSAIILAATGSVIFNADASGSFNFSGGLYILLSCMSGIIFLTNQNERSRIFQAGLFVSIINIMLIAVFHFIPNSQYTIVQYLIYFLLGIGSGVGSAVLTIGLLPFFEAGFGILSTIKLIELSNPNHPLLKKILTEAPGTYHHSVMVANLADAACEAIGANGLLARVGCYYHDIGKTRRPKFFVENQINIDNPHNNLDPVVSKDIIMAHTTDGAEILQKHRMPKEIIDIAKQHHGTSMIKYFYYKAKEAGLDVDEQSFRYPGPKPQTKEAAVINIADSVEAAVRSMKNPDLEKIADLVKNIIKDRLNDEQFIECNLTMKELTIVEKTFLETLHGTFHSRIEYPKDTKEER